MHHLREFFAWNTEVDGDIIKSGCQDYKSRGVLIPRGGDVKPISLFFDLLHFFLQVNVDVIVDSNPPVIFQSLGTIRFRMVGDKGNSANFESFRR